MKEKLLETLGESIHSLRTSTMLHAEGCHCSPCVVAENLAAAYLALRDGPKGTTFTCPNVENGICKRPGGCWCVGLDP